MLYHDRNCPKAANEVIGERMLDSGSSARPERKGPARTIGMQLLLWVNVSWIIIAATFLAYDYRRDLNERLQEKHIALHEEAKTLMPAVLQVRRYGPDEIQAYIDAVCGQMRDSQSPGHHIVVEADGKVVQATAHHRASPAMLSAVRQAARSPSSRAAFGSQELVVGSASRTGTTVYVSESLENMRRSVVGDSFLRLTAMFVMAAMATVIVNVVLWRVVTRPLRRLIMTVKEIGQGRLGAQAGTFSTMELDFLAREINAMSRSLAAADEDRKEQMAQARDIQRSLLPERLEIPGMDVDCTFLPADDVGGDYFDAVGLADGGHLLAIADVTGHGVPAAMSAAMLKVLLLQASERFESPASMLTYINRMLVNASLESSFVSMALARCDTNGSRFVYASAGHEPSWLIMPDGTTVELSSTGILLGILDETKWEDRVINVGAGCRLLMLTDGVSETLSSSGEMFGRKRIVSHLKAHRHNPVAETLIGLTQALQCHRHGRPQHDDVTMLLVELNGTGRNCYR